MLATIRGSNSQDYDELLQQVWRFRHRQFVERLGWDACRRADGREMDQFDGDEAVHLPLIHAGEVVAYSRLLPTLKPHLLSDVYPHLTDGGEYPRGKCIFEWTKCIADPSDMTVRGISVSGMLIMGVMEYCLVTGIELLIVETHQNFVNLLLTAGWDVRPLAAPTVLDDGSLIVPITARPTMAGLLRHHKLYGISGSVLDRKMLSEVHFDMSQPSHRASVEPPQAGRLFSRMAGESHAG
ncbi:GNAT family N-acetyltransferase [Rhizobium sp. AQ_MP]|uniref:acyl-homoserine-lactone synthase n=1 Tax=Rhizobium sp. AQ_MP TaxID=2761536 RepID=UPI00163B50EF|nr:acyl-homoserine-lactone synthase [Rhizobium sp. AQ_MP]MBC2773867.1 GNAT family N-acetyltransferase [Rhizobium sp. AQ_MP]